MPDIPIRERSVVYCLVEKLFRTTEKSGSSHKNSDRGVRMQTSMERTLVVDSPARRTRSQTVLPVPHPSPLAGEGQDILPLSPRGKGQELLPLSPWGEGKGEGVFIPRDLLEQLAEVCLEALPHKAYGLVGGKDLHHPQNIYPCSTNLRNTPEWKRVFESFGDFYKEPDRGFVITPREYLETSKKMADRGESFIGVFHSHRCRCAEPSEVDMAFHFDSSLLYIIVSVVDTDNPEVKIYRLHKTHYEEIPFQIF